jgi:hypothetical protein
MNIRYAASLIAFATGATYAQAPIEIRDVSGAIVNEQVVVYFGDVNAPVLTEYLTTELMSGPSRVVNVRRYELDVQPNTQNYFCWGVCYGPVDAGSLPVWNAFGQHALDMEMGVPLSNFSAYHSPFGQVGNSTYRYVWFDTAVPTDSVWCDIQFRAIDNVGVEELAPSVSLSAFPNPSQGADVQFQLDIRNVDRTLDLVVFNALGERVRTITVRPGTTTARLGTVSLAEGLYFVSVVDKGNALSTKRFVVTGR